MFLSSLQMSPLKKSAIKKSTKCQRTSSDAFRNDDADMAYNNNYKRAPIILERIVDELEWHEIAKRGGWSRGE